MATGQSIVVFLLFLFALTKGEDAKATERRFEELERRLNDHETIIDELQKTVATQQATIQDQQATIQGQNRLIQNIQSELRTGQESRKKHSMQLEVIQRDIYHVKQMFEQHTTTDDDETATQTDMGGDNRIRQTLPGLKTFTRRQERTNVAFSAYLDHDIPTFDQLTLKFNSVLTNEGHGYSGHTGVFTCPESGMYLLTYSIGEGAAEYELSTKLMVNSINLVDSTSYTYHYSQTLQGGNSVLYRLAAGDRVWVEVTTGGIHVKGSSGMRWTTFSGVFMYR